MMNEWNDIQSNTCLLGVDIENGSNSKEVWTVRPLQSGDLEELKEICHESFPIEYPNSWYQEVLNGKLISFGISHNDKLVALLVAEIKPISHCNTEVCSLFIFTCSIYSLLDLYP